MENSIIYPVILIIASLVLAGAFRLFDVIESLKDGKKRFQEGRIIVRIFFGTQWVEGRLLKVKNDEIKIGLENGEYVTKSYSEVVKVNYIRKKDLYYLSWLFRWRYGVDKNTTYNSKSGKWE